MGVLLNLTKEYFRDDIRTEDGIIVNIEGEKYIIKYDTHPFARNICSFGDDDEGNDIMYIKKEFDFFDEPVYLFNSYGDNGSFVDYYFIKENDLKESENKIIGEELKHLISSDLSDDDETFKILYVLYKTELMQNWIDFDDDDDIKLKEEYNHYTVKISDVREISIYSDKSALDEATKTTIEDFFDGEFSKRMTREEVEQNISFYGDSWIDKSSLENWYKEDYESYINEIENEKGEHGNRLFDEMLDAEIIEETSEYFEVDLSEPTFEPDDYKDELIKNISEEDEISEEEAKNMVEDFDDDELIENMIKYDVVNKDEEYFELDFNNPKFDIYEKKEEFKEYKVDDIDDVVDQYLFEFSELPSSYYDLGKMAELELEADGRGKWMSSYDNEEYTCEIDDTEYFCYIN